MTVDAQPGDRIRVEWTENAHPQRDRFLVGTVTDPEDEVREETIVFEDHEGQEYRLWPEGQLNRRDIDERDPYVGEREFWAVVGYDAKAKIIAEDQTHSASCTECPWSKTGEDFIEVSDEAEKHQQKERHHVNVQRAAMADGGNDVLGPPPGATGDLDGAPAGGDERPEAEKTDGGEYTRLRANIQLGDGPDQRGDVTVEICRRRESGAERSVEIPDAPIPDIDEGDDASELVDIDVDNRAFAEFCVEVMRARQLLANELGLEEGDA